MPLEALLNLLLRHGCTTVEQVAAASDAELLEIRHRGESSVALIRGAIAALQAVAYPADATVVLTGGQVGELVTLLTTLAVYADARGRRDVARLARAFLEETVPSGLQLIASTAADTPR